MNKIRSIKKKAYIDYSFYFPYLVQFATIPLQLVDEQVKKHKRLRYHSAKKIVQSSKNEKKGLYLTNFINNKREKQPKSINKSVVINPQKINFIETNFSEISVKNHIHRTSYQKHKQIKSSSKFQRRSSPIRYRTIQYSKAPTIQNQNTQNNKISLTTCLNFSQIPGVKFKKSEQAQQNEKYAIDRTHIRKVQESKWDKQRMANIEFIINRKCNNFQDIMAQYYQRSSHQQATFIFIFDSHDGWMKRVLLKKGWTQNKNKQSKAFHILWTYKLPLEPLYPQQMVNHYHNSHKLTTKIGLFTTLKKYNLSFIQPKTYDLNHQKQKIVDHYARIAFHVFLKQFLSNLQYQQFFKAINANQLKEQIKQLLSERCQDEQEQFFQRQLKCMLQLCLNLFQNTKFSFERSTYNAIKLIKQKIELIPLHDRMIKALIKMQKILSVDQTLAGNCHEGLANMWIIKSYCSSKGAGIQLSDSIDFISNQTNRIAQKYIENVLLLKGFNNRKFDLRLWVLVKGNFKNCQVYFNEQFYGRLCFKPYRLQHNSIKESSVHFSNYSINKHSYKQDRKISSILFPNQLFQEILLCKDVNYKQIFYKKIQTLLLSLTPIFKNQLCTKTNENHFELFGFDLLIDDQLNIHLLEINLSPQCQERHQRLTRMLQTMGEGIINILEDKSDLKHWKRIA